MEPLSVRLVYRRDKVTQGLLKSPDVLRFTHSKRECVWDRVASREKKHVISVSKRKQESERRPDNVYHKKDGTFFFRGKGIIKDEKYRVELAKEYSGKRP